MTDLEAVLDDLRKVDHTLAACLTMLIEDDGVFEDIPELDEARTLVQDYIEQLEQRLNDLAEQQAERRNEPPRWVGRA